MANASSRTPRLGSQEYAIVQAGAAASGMSAGEYAEEVVRAYLSELGVE